MHILNEVSLGKFGLFLTPTERKHFPDHMIKPMYGVGVKGRSRPRPAYIFAYQMIVQPCPYYMPKVRRCLIYDMRPLACGQFPISGTSEGILLHRECPEIAHLIPENATVTRNQVKGLDTEFKALQVMTAYFVSIYVYNTFNVDTSVAWVYPLDKNRWIQPTEEDWLETLGKLKDRMKVIDKWRTRKDTVPKSMQ